MSAAGRHGLHEHDRAIVRRRRDSRRACSPWRRCRPGCREERRSAWTQLAAAALGHVACAAAHVMSAGQGSSSTRSPVQPTSESDTENQYRKVRMRVSFSKRRASPSGLILFRHWAPSVGLRTPLWTRRAPQYHIRTGAVGQKPFGILPRSTCARAARMSWDLLALVWPRRLSSATSSSRCSMSSL